MTPLEVGKRVERALAAGESNAFEVVLEAGGVLRGEVQQHGIDVVVTIQDPAGKTLATIDDTGDTSMERLDWTAPVSGSFRLVMRPFKPDAAPGRYEVRVTELLTAQERAEELAAAKRERDAFARVTQPAYPPDGKVHPLVLFDEAHNNGHTSSKGYGELCDLLKNDGYRLTVNTQRLDAQALDGVRILIVPTPQAFPNEAVDRSASEITYETWGRPAMTERECDAVQQFVELGGSLLLITGHAPRAFWSQPLAGRFGVDVNNSFTYDAENSYRPEATRPPGCWIVFSRENGLLEDHPITSGRGPGQRIQRITVNGSASLAAPPSGRLFLRLADSAHESIATDFAFWRNARGYEASAAGRGQGVALRHGKGRVVVLTPTAPFTYAYMKRAGSGDSRQLALNVLRWLSGWLDPE